MNERDETGGTGGEYISGVTTGGGGAGDGSYIILSRYEVMALEASNRAFATPQSSDAANPNLVKKG